MAAKTKYKILNICDKDICVLCPNNKAYEEIKAKLKRIIRYSLDWFDEDIMRRHGKDTVIAFVRRGSNDRTIKVRYGEVAYVKRCDWELLNIDDIDWNI